MTDTKPRRAAPRARSVAVVPLLLGATASGTLVLASFPPFGFGWLMWTALVPLFAVHERLGRWTLLGYGYLLAAVPIWSIAFGIAASSVPTFAVIATTVPLAFAVGIAAASELERRLDHPMAKLLVFPCFAVVLEWGLGTERVGMPATIALTQSAMPVLIQNADLFGTAGTTFLLLLVNRALGALAHAPRDPRMRAPAVVAATLFFANVAYGLHQRAAGTGTTPSFTVAAVQPAIATADYVNRRLDDGVQARIDRTVETLTEEALRTKPDLLVLSEGGNGRYNFRVPGLRRRLEDVARRNGVGLVVSSLDLTPTDEESNALFSLDADGRLRGSHRKSILTPVGERHLRPGTERLPLASAIGSVGAMVCFESCFPGVAAALVRNGAAVLLVSTSDASFRNSALPLLHSAFSIFRAVETRRYLLQAANTGPSLVIDPAGAIVGRTGFLDREVLVGRVAPRHETTVFVRAPWLAPALATIFLATALGLAMRRRTDSALERPRIAFLPAGPRDAALGAAAYAGWVALLAVASIHLATVGTPTDDGVVGNVAAFLAAAPDPDVRGSTEPFRQREPNGCGPAALAYLLHLHGLETREADVATRVRLDADGTSMLELSRAAETFGVVAYGERLNVAALRTIQRPVIAHLPDQNHFVVVLGVEHDTVYLFDPAVGPIRADIGDFARAWSGATLRIGFRSSPELDSPLVPVGSASDAGGMLVPTQHQPAASEGDTTCAPHPL